MRLDNRLADREPEASALFLGRTEGIEYALGNRRIDSWTEVDHADLDLVTVVPARANDDPSLAHTGHTQSLYCIVDEIQQYLLDLNAVDIDGWKIIGKLE